MHSTMKFLVLSFSFTLFLYYTPCAQVRTLEFFIQQAKENSPLLKDYKNQIRSNRLDSQILRATFKTQVNFISSNSYAPVIKGYGYDGAITNGANITALVQANRNFYTAGNVAMQYRTIGLQNLALGDTIRLSEKDLSRTVIDQYITTYGDMVMVDFNKEIYELLKKEEVVLKKLTQASVYKQTDYLSFYVTMQQQALTLSQAKIQYNSDFLTLNYLSGYVDTAIYRVQEPTLNDAMQNDFFNSVFYRQFTTDSLRLATERALINYSYKPRIGAYTDAGYNSTLVYTPYKNFGFSFGVSVAIPIYDGRQKALKFKKIDIAEETRLIRKNFFVSQYQQQIAQLKLELQATDELVASIQQQIKFANALITANGKLLETGDIRVTDYVLALNNYLAARNLLNQNFINRLRIVNQINYWNR